MPEKKSTKDDENLLKPGEEEGEGYEGTPDMYPDYEEDKKDKKNKKKKTTKLSEGGSIRYPQQPIKGVKPIQVKGTKFQGIF
jgi:hypothetical protein